MALAAVTTIKLAPSFRWSYSHLSPCCSSIFRARSQNVFDDRERSYEGAEEGGITTNANFGKNKWQTPKTGHKMDGTAKTRLQTALDGWEGRAGVCEGVKGHRTIYVQVVCVEIFRANKSHTNKGKQTNRQANKQTNKQAVKEANTAIEIGNSRMLLLATDVPKIIVTSSRSCIKNWPRTQAQIKKCFPVMSCGKCNCKLFAENEENWLLNFYRISIELLISDN